MLILIADAHLREGALARGGRHGADEFFEMLSAISSGGDDVLFLGDNLDIWIGLGGGYETSLHRRFLSWCRSERGRRRVLFVEGNHEFYVCRHERESFTECTETGLQLGSRLFVHGDLTQRLIGFHRLFRLFAKNAFGDFLMRWLPFGVWFSNGMQQLLGHRPKASGCDERGDFMPRAQVESWVSGRSGVSEVYMGHFHFASSGEAGGVRYRVIPAWKYDGEVGVLDESSGAFRVGGWREVLETRGGGAG